MFKVSTIIPSYNCAKFLPDAIDSVLAQTYQDFEIIVVDDGSIDNTKNIVERYTKRYGEKIRYIYQSNRGLAAARNTGLRHSRGEYIALLDADDEWLSNRLAEGVKGMEENPSVGLVHANSVRISEIGDVIRVNKRNPRFLSGWIFKYLFLRRADISCPTVLFRKECTDRLGGFDEGLTRLGCEDRELWLRIAKKYPFFYINKILARYRVRGNSMSKDRAKMLKARYYVIDKFSDRRKLFLLRQRALMQVHKELGDEFLEENNYEDARREYKKALQFWPFAFWVLFNLTKTILIEKNT